VTVFNCYPKKDEQEYSIEYLRQFASILIFNNYGFDSARLADALVEYVDSSKKMFDVSWKSSLDIGGVLTMWGNQLLGQWQNKNYDCFEKGLVVLVMPVTINFLQRLQKLCHT
jgi:hypothetical protein